MASNPSILWELLFVPTFRSIIPFASEAAVYFAKEVPNAEGMFMTPIVGWISGFDLSENDCARVYDGITGTCYTDKAIGLHIRLPENKTASIGIVNIFDTDNANASIEFMEDTLSVKKCLINGKEVLFSDYIIENNIDTQLPLVSDYNSVLVNVSIKNVSKENKTVELYAPVFKGMTYRFSNAVTDYSAEFSERLKNYANASPLFSCNCILNYLYGKLYGKVTTPFAGPVTFGEIAYQLLNQTLVYAEIIDQ